MAGAVEPRWKIEGDSERERCGMWRRGEGDVRGEAQGKEAKSRARGEAGRGRGGHEVDGGEGGGGSYDNGAEGV